MNAMSANPPSHANPLLALQFWLEAQAPEISAAIIGSVLSLSTPGANHGGLLKPSEDLPRDIGRALQLRALIEFTHGMDFTAEGRATKRERLDAFIEGLDDRSDGAEMRATFDAQHAGWMRAGARWRELCEGSLSDERLHTLLYRHAYARRK